MANKKINSGYEQLKVAGKNFLTAVIEEINNTGDFNILRSEAYNDFVKFYSEYEGNKKVEEASTCYLFANYCLTRLHNLHTLALNDFDRQSLKLTSVLNDMYIIERDISNIAFYQHNRENIRKFMEIEEEANRVADEFIRTMQEHRGKMTEEQYRAFDSFIEMNTASKKILLDEKRMLQKEKADIDKLKADDNFIGNCNKDDSTIGLLKVIYRSLATIQSIEIFLEALYSMFQIDTKLDIKKFYELTSFSVLRKRIDMLISLADDNNSIDREFRKSDTYFYLMDYMDLKEKVEAETTKKKFEAEKRSIAIQLEEYFDLDDLSKAQEGDVDEIIDRYIIACKLSLQRELRW